MLIGKEEDLMIESLLDGLDTKKYVVLCYHRQTDKQHFYQKSINPHESHLVVKAGIALNACACTAILHTTMRGEFKIGVVSFRLFKSIVVLLINEIFKRFASVYLWFYLLLTSLKFHCNAVV